MPEVNRFKKRKIDESIPLEVLRRVTEWKNFSGLGTPPAQVEEAMKYLSKAFDETARSTGISEFSEEYRSGFRKEPVVGGWGQVIAYVETPELFTLGGPGIGKVKVDTSTAKVYYFIPYPGKVRKDHALIAYKTSHNVPRILTSNPVFSLHVRKLAEELLHNEKGPHRIEIVPVSLVHEGGRISVSRNLAKGIPGYLVMVSLPTELYREEIKRNTLEFIKKFIEIVERHL